MAHYKRKKQKERVRRTSGYDTEKVRASYHGWHALLPAIRLQMIKVKEELRDAA
jgi:hypothetical protein